jgi:hypothetical protein
MSEREARYDVLLKQMPAGLDRAVLRVLSQRVGREQAVGRGQLVRLVGQGGFQANERQIRAMIKELRRQGHLICSASGESGGYWMAANRKEVEQFGQQEFEAKISDMSETWKAMRKSADEKFGTAVQERLF